MNTFWLGIVFTLSIIGCDQAVAQSTTKKTTRAAEKAGCMDKLACNYDFGVTKDDGTCTYSPRCYPTDGCTNYTSCNYNPGATHDDGSCTKPPNSGMDCKGNLMKMASDGKMYFIANPIPVPLTKGRAHARVDLPVNFEMGFEITPQRRPASGFANIIHVTATGTNCCGFGTRAPAIWFRPNSFQMYVRDGDKSDGNLGCNPWKPLKPMVMSKVRVQLRDKRVAVYVNDEQVCTAVREDRMRFRGAFVYAADPWYTPAPASINNFYFKYLSEIRGCTSRTACNFNPEATKDNGSCEPAKKGYDCGGKKLEADVNGAKFFISTMVPIALMKSLSHAEMDLPENFEIGFQITPQKTPLRSWTSIVHFTATGKNCCGVGDGIPSILFSPGTFKLIIRDGDKTDGRAGCNPTEPLKPLVMSKVKVQLRDKRIAVYVNGEQVCTAGRQDRAPWKNAIVYASDPWHTPANALINQFYFKPLAEITGCTSMTACNYNSEATKDDGSCKPAKDGYDCGGNKLTTDMVTGVTYFINTKAPILLMRSLSHAEVDLPENFEVGFEITPQKDPVSSWSNIVHFTATGKNCCGVGDRVPGIWFRPKNFKLHVRDGDKTDGNIGCDPPEALKALTKYTVKVQLRDTKIAVYVNGEQVCTAAREDRSVYKKAIVYAADPWYLPANALINKFYMKPLPEIPGCTSMTGCNYNPDATKDDGTCYSAPDGSDCSGAKLTPDMLTGVTYFIRTKKPSPLLKGLSHATVDLSENFEVGFDIIPQKAVPKQWTNIVHFTATGKSCCGVGDRVPSVSFWPNSFRLHIRDGDKSDGNVGCDPQAPLKPNNLYKVKIQLRDKRVAVYVNGSQVCTQARQDRAKYTKAIVYAADPWHVSANALINNFYMKPLKEIQGCTSMTACNYDPDATKADPEKCEEAKDGYDCNGNKLSTDMITGVTFFIRTKLPMQLMRRLSHAEVDLPANFEVGFDITPLQVAKRAYTNIIHLTANGKNCCGPGSRVPGVWFKPGSFRLMIRDGDKTTANAGCDPARPLKAKTQSTVKIQMREKRVAVYVNGEQVCTATRKGRDPYKKAIVYAADPWHNAANALINNFYYKPLSEVKGCTSMSACNFNPDATKGDPESCVQAKDGFDCNGKALTADTKGSTFFIRTADSMQLMRGLSHAQVDLPTNFEVGFDITPGDKPMKYYTNIIHFTATGKNCCRVGDRVPGVFFKSGTFRLSVRDGDASNGNAGCDPQRELVPGQLYHVRIQLRDKKVAVYVNGEQMCTATRQSRAAYKKATVYASDPWHYAANAAVNNFYMKPLAVVSGCTSMTACNFNSDATNDDGSCKPAKTGYDCSGKKLDSDSNGATFFIRTAKPMPLVRSLSHARVDLPTNFEVGFEITPQGTVKGPSNIIHFTATGKNCCRVGDRAPGVWIMPNSLKFAVRDGDTSNGNLGCVPQEPFKKGVMSRVKIQLRDKKMTVYVNGEQVCTVKRDTRKPFKKAIVYASDPWYTSANALINHFYFKKLAVIQGCTSMTACNYNPDATKDDGSCNAAKDGYDCKGNQLSADVNGATFFIRTSKPAQLVRSLSHARVDLPENFEVGFEITPQKTPKKSWSNIVHFTATGKNCCGVGDRVPAVWFFPNSFKFTVRDGDKASGNAGCTPQEPLKPLVMSKVKIQLRDTRVEVYVNGEQVCAKSREDRAAYKNAIVYAADPWYTPANALINHFYFKKLADVPGCTSMSACNYNTAATKDDGSCKAAKDGYDCKGKQLSADVNGATFFIRTASPVKVSRSLSQAKVDLPQFFEVGFEITPQKTPAKTWSNIVHFTASGKNCCGVGDRSPLVSFWPGSFRLHVRDGDASDGNAGCDPKMVLKPLTTYNVKIRLLDTQLAVYVNNKQVCLSTRDDIRAAYKNAIVYAADPWYTPANAWINHFYFKPLGIVAGCVDSSACNYNQDATKDDGTCDAISCQTNKNVGKQDLGPAVAGGFGAVIAVILIVGVVLFILIRRKGGVRRREFGGGQHGSELLTTDASSRYEAPRLLDDDSAQQVFDDDI